MVALKLVFSKALSTLLYGTLNLTNSQVASLEHMWNRAYLKLSRHLMLKLSHIICSLKGICHVLHKIASQLYAIHKMNFLNKLQVVDNPVINFIASKSNESETEKLSLKLTCISSTAFINKFQSIFR